MIRECSSKHHTIIATTQLDDESSPSENARRKRVGETKSMWSMAAHSADMLWCFESLWVDRCVLQCCRRTTKARRP